MKIFEADIKSLFKAESEKLPFEAVVFESKKPKEPSNEAAEKQSGESEAMTLERLSAELEYQNRRYNKTLTI